MGYNRFIRNLIFRVLLLFATLVILSAIFLRVDLLFNQLILAALIIVQLWSLVNYVTKTNRELARFLDSIRDGDFTVLFADITEDATFKKLNRSFGGLISKLNQQETERSAQNHFLKALIEHIPFGILVLQNNDHIRLINTPAQESLNIPDIRTWQKLKTDRTHLLDRLATLTANRPHLIEIKNAQFTVMITELRIQSEPLKIISIKNIQTELSEKETDAWHKLIRVLTHEIMNSVTPISSITQTVRSMLRANDTLDTEAIRDLREAIDTVHTRSAGILTFVKKYRQMSKILVPQKEPVDIVELVRRVLVLMEANNPAISISLDAPSTESLAPIMCDPAQLEQVLINLIKNAQEAFQNIQVQSRRTITVQIRKERHNLIISIEDYGSGIAEKQLERIFIPFYTTKRNGSGIGLGLCRQIIQNHHGTLTCENPRSPTLFVIRLPH